MEANSLKGGLSGRLCSLSSDTMEANSLRILLEILVQVSNYSRDVPCSLLGFRRAHQLAEFYQLGLSVTVLHQEQRNETLNVIERSFNSRIIVDWEGLDDKRGIFTALADSKLLSTAREY